MLMLLKGVAFCHKAGVIHRVRAPVITTAVTVRRPAVVGTRRPNAPAPAASAAGCCHVPQREYCGVCAQDIKPNNLLVSSTGVLKIADFGLARVHITGQEKPYTHQVATRYDDAVYYSGRIRCTVDCVPRVGALIRDRCVLCVMVCLCYVCVCIYVSLCSCAGGTVHPSCCLARGTTVKRWICGRLAPSSRSC